MIGISVILVFALIFWLDIWTHHGERIMVPRVIWLSYNDACRQLEDADFNVVLQDSVYDDKSAPGEVIDQNPKDSTYVKESRTVFLTINAFMPRMVVVPNLKDISLRQALVTLEGLGLKNYQVKEVPSEFNNMVLSVSYNGKHLLPGTRLPLSAFLTIEVGKGNNMDTLLVDSISDTGNDIVIIDENEPTSSSSNTAEPSTNQTEPVRPESEPDFFD